MLYRTFGDLKDQVHDELDTQDETFIGEAEMMRYFNSGVTVCEATIIKLGVREKYLQTEAFISTVAGQADYALPADMALNKIRKIIYRRGTLIYTLKPLRNETGYETEDVMNVYPTNEYYHYSLYKTGETQILRLTPKALYDLTNALRIIYFKTLNRYTQDTDICDLPDICYEFLMSYVRYRIYAKETHVNTPDEKANMAALNQLMQETMQNQVADPEMDLNEADMSHYEEMS